MAEVKGLKELSAKLNQLDKKVAGKTLRQSAMNATTPAFKTMQQRAPKGSKSHRTYKGNLVAPGFLSRSVKRYSEYKNGVARVVLGVRREAYYGVVYVEKGTKPHRIPKKGHTALKFNGGVFSHVNHPGAKANPWFVSSFKNNRKKMEDRFAAQLKAKIERL